MGNRKLTLACLYGKIKAFLRIQKGSYFFLTCLPIQCNHNDSLLLDASIMVSKNCPIVGKHIVIITVTQ